MPEIPRNRALQVLVKGMAEGELPQYDEKVGSSNIISKWTKSCVGLPAGAHTAPLTAQHMNPITGGRSKGIHHVFLTGILVSIIAMSYHL